MLAFFEDLLLLRCNNIAKIAAILLGCFFFFLFCVFLEIKTFDELRLFSFILFGMAGLEWTLLYNFYLTQTLLSVSLYHMEPMNISLVQLMKYLLSWPKASSEVDYLIAWNVCSQFLLGHIANKSHNDFEGLY